MSVKACIRHCLNTVGQNVQLLWEQTDFDVTVGHCLVSGDTNACWVPVRHNTVSDGEIKICPTTVPNSVAQGLRSLNTGRAASERIQMQ